ncbi:integrin alpha [Sphingobacterium paludis]|uniref:Uncharacterized protein n=1 Tax=Sphingobacterium paludis TaxID=1476465 RepID=A0A4R7DBT3_9SPHI|nr:integrin alpha [Sphingobacterium paludis]TDS17741.1 hypothetical protein B0I21_101614 [Sphingobacterium paludis]
MHNYFLAVFASLLFLSCQNIGSKPRQQNVISAEQLPDTIASDAAANHSVPSSVAPELVEGMTMLSGTYRIWEETDDPTAMVDSNWLEIFTLGSAVQVQPLSYHIITGFDDCAGVNTKTINTTNKSLVFVKPGKIKTGVKNQVDRSKALLWPGVKTSFSFQGANYSLEGTGTINGSETFTDDTKQTYTFHNVTNYALQLIDQQGNAVTLVSEESFNDTFIELLFVGDLDGDHLPDFIISAPRHYEEERTLLILSTERENGKVKAFEAARQFDC